MKCFEVVGYTCDGAAYCVDCWNEHNSAGDEDNVIFADSEWDSYPTCDACREQIEDVRLTADGLTAKWWADLDDSLRADVIDQAMAWHGGMNTACYELLSQGARCPARRALSACREMQNAMEQALLVNDDAESDLEVIQTALEGTHLL